MTKRQIKNLLSHYTLAPLLGLFIVAWLLSGIVMLFVPFPELEDLEKELFSLPIRSEELRNFAPKLGTTKSLTITKQLGAISSNRKPIQLSIEKVDARIRAFFKSYDVTYLGQSYNDQWTVHGRYNQHRPLLTWQIHDENERVIYVSSYNGQIVQDTTQHERIWNYVGAVLHWIYATPIREKRDFWVYLVNLLTLAAWWMTALGFLRGWKLLRIRRRYRKKKISPFWNSLKYHHIMGVFFGFFIMTWLFSGFLSMSPFAFMAEPQITATERTALVGGKWKASDVTQVRHLIEEYKNEIDRLKPWKVIFRISLGAPIIEIFSKNGRQIFSAESFSARDSVTVLEELHLGLDAKVDLIQHYDISYSSARLPLPVFRIQLQDAEETWYEVDARTGVIVQKSHWYSRLDHWLFKGLHTFDFGHNKQWDWLRKLIIVVISMLSLGLIGAGFYSFGLKAMKKISLAKSAFLPRKS